MVRYRYDPFCVKSSIKVIAEVEEAGRGTKIAESITIPLVISPIEVKFADDNSKVFRPGLNYSLKVCICSAIVGFHLYAPVDV